jgi:dTDP-glucose 4,6-dehydratase
MRFLLTGGCGVIGSHLCSLLISRGDEVVCIDNRSTGSIKNVEHLMNHPRFIFLNLNVATISSNGDNQYNCLIDEKKIDGIFHLASPTAPGDVCKLPEQTVAVNDAGTVKLMEFAKRKGAKLLFASSVKVLGDCPRVQPYIIGKREGERLCLENGFKIARLGSVYGPRMRVDDSRVIPVFITKSLKNETISVWNGGKQLDSFCYVDDIVKGLAKFMDSEHSGVIEFGSPIPTSIMSLAEIILGINGSKSEIITNENVLVVDECHKVPDISAARNYLRWQPETGLRVGITKTIEYYKEIMQ